MKLDFRFAIAVRVLALMLGLCSAWPENVFGAEVTIKNPKKEAMTLSDLIVYGKQINQQEIILHRGFAIDDEVIAAGASKTFTTSFPVVTAAMSTTKNGKESELIVQRLDVKFGFTPVGWLENAGNGSALFPFIDAVLADVPPEEGTILNFSAGLSPQLPGWFVGTTLDLDQGIVLDGFTGEARMLFSGAEVAAVPETSSLALLAIAIATLGAGVRRLRLQRVL